MLQVKDLYKEYSIGPNTVTALQGINLAVEKGEYIAVMGPSGSGKSTFMNILGCLDRPTKGTYCLAGEDVGAKSDDELALIRNQYIGFIFQSFNLLPRLNALENVALPLIYRGLPAGERIRKAKEALEAVGLHERIHHLPSELSGGQQQRVAIARALAGNPLLILADEPTGNLDSRSGSEVMGIFRKLNMEGITIILVTHDEQVALQTKRVIRFKDGVMQSDERTGQPSPLKTHPAGGVVNL
ncbi:MAG: ABC transporter ATP-binding protein [Peptococcaceae bacterium]|jgi:putative ABC transport system ATP-binding protein|nr:ABC transporter ATP-binding protein [Peptococcaceae bacterium]MDH7524922.1 ABC transporter ATP-binding protein [Peptococcaceae bacterium]